MADVAIHTFCEQLWMNENVVRIEMNFFNIFNLIFVKHWKTVEIFEKNIYFKINKGTQKWMKMKCHWRLMPVYCLRLRFDDVFDWLCMFWHATFMARFKFFYYVWLLFVNIDPNIGGLSAIVRRFSFDVVQNVYPSLLLIYFLFQTLFVCL